MIYKLMFVCVFLLLCLLSSSVSFVRADVEVGGVGNGGVDGVIITIPEPPTNYSLFPTVNSSEIWITNEGNMDNVVDLYAILDPRYIDANNSWNQSLADTLYAGIEWNYNQSLATYNMWNDDWSSTYNATYAAKADYQFTNNNFNGSGNFTTTADIRADNYNATGYIDIDGDIIADDEVRLSSDSSSFILTSKKSGGGVATSAIRGFTNVLQDGTYYLPYTGGSQTLASSDGAITFSLRQDFAATGTSITVAEKIEHYGDTDTYIQFTPDIMEVTAGNFEMVRYREAFGSGSVTFNRNNDNTDVVIEGGTNANLFKTDANVDRIGINDATPDYLLDVEGACMCDDYYSGDDSQGITDTTSYWLCTAADCSSSCQVSIKDGLITGCA